MQKRLLEHHAVPQVQQRAQEQEPRYPKRYFLPVRATQASERRAPAIQVLGLFEILRRPPTPYGARFATTALNWRLLFTVASDFEIIDTYYFKICLL